MEQRGRRLRHVTAAAGPEARNRAFPGHPSLPDHVLGEAVPAAVSATSMMNWLPARWQVTVTSPPGRVCLIALDTRLPMACLVPAELAPFLPYRTLNQGQAEVVPEILGHDRNLLVVAPTGAGKTVLGMVAALRAVVQQGRKTAWLVPQRSLANELDRELETWRERGLRVERLSGEYATDMARIKDADMWVATTEKFEALCRTAALRESLAEVGVLIVDEIHMLGDATRGPVLEALLTRIREGAAETRIVGLSATVSNAEQVAGWLGADLIRSSWRPTRLTWQLPVIGANADFAVTEAARTRLAHPPRGRDRRARHRRRRQRDRVLRQQAQRAAHRPGDRGEQGSEHLRRAAGRHAAA